MDNKDVYANACYPFGGDFSSDVLESVVESGWRVEQLAERSFVFGRRGVRGCFYVRRSDDGESVLAKYSSKYDLDGMCERMMKGGEDSTFTGEIEDMYFRHIFVGWAVEMVAKASVEQFFKEP